MFFNLNGKTALITGASSGLGERMAFVLAERSQSDFSCQKRGCLTRN